MVPQEPGDCVRPVAAFRNRRIARTFGGLLHRNVDLGLENFEPVVGIGLALLDLLAGELTPGDRIEALDALRNVAIGDAFHLELMEIGEIGNLLE